MVSCSGSLVQSCCGEGGALQTDIAVCGEHSPCSGHTGFAPFTVCAFPGCSGSRLLYMERALHCARFQFSGPPQKRGLGWACFCAFPAGAAQAARSLTGALSPGAVRLLPSAVPASVSARASRVHFVSTLLADVNHPQSQGVFG